MSSGNDPIFESLTVLQPTLSKPNQNLIPVLIKLFTDFRTKVVSDLEEKFNASTNAMKEEWMTVCKAKDEKIVHLQNSCTILEKKCFDLEDKIDATEAYERKDTIVISGAVPPSTEGEDITRVTIDLLKAKLPGIEMHPTDISICHRLQKKRSADGTIKPPNIYVKLVRREQKKALILASKSQPKTATNKIFVNESLTQQRSSVLHTLLKLKKDHDVIKGATSMEGNVYAYTEPPPPAHASSGGTRSKPKDIRHLINNRRSLQKFCDDYLRRPLEELLEA